MASRRIRQEGMQHLGFTRVGNPHGKPLAIVHGWGCDSSFLLPIADMFRERDVYLIDLPGYGESMHLSPFAQDLVSTTFLLINTLPDGADVMAWSFGTLYVLRALSMISDPTFKNSKRMIQYLNIQQPLPSCPLTNHPNFNPIAFVSDPLKASVHQSFAQETVQESLMIAQAMHRSLQLHPSISSQLYSQMFNEMEESEFSFNHHHPVISCPTLADLHPESACFPDNLATQYCVSQNNQTDEKCLESSQHNKTYGNSLETPSYNQSAAALAINKSKSNLSSAAFNLTVQGTKLDAQSEEQANRNKQVLVSSNVQFLEPPSLVKTDEQSDAVNNLNIQVAASQAKPLPYQTADEIEQKLQVFDMLSQVKIPRIHSLTTICGSPRFPADPNWPGINPVRILKLNTELNSRRLKTVLNLFYHMQFSVSNPKLDKLLKRCLSIHPPISDAVLMSGIHQVSFMDERPALQHLSIPSLHLFGAKDHLVPYKIANLLPQDDLHYSYIFPYSSHNPFLTEPEEFELQIRKFFERIANYK